MHEDANDPTDLTLKLPVRTIATLDSSNAVGEHESCSVLPPFSDFSTRAGPLPPGWPGPTLE